MIFRLSHKLGAKIKAGILPTLPLDQNPLADWSAHLFVANRVQYILLSNTKSLYSLVLPGKGITTTSRFIDDALSSMREFMEADGFEFAFGKLIAPACGSVQFAMALDRSVTGSISEMIYDAACYLEEGRLSLFRISARLNERPMSALNPKRNQYGFPREVFAALAKV